MIRLSATDANERAAAPVSLDDKYTQESGTVFLSGMQALVRLPMLQRRIDLAAGRNTAGYVTGYRGSPIGGYDRELWRARRHLDAHAVRFQPGLNEDLAATAVWGTQQLHVFPKPRYDGVFSIWYGKNPGLDRAGDAIRHANHAGTAPQGGVLCIVGDDHTGKSSAFGVQSEYAFADFMMPVLSPATLQDFVDLGLFGFALSRYCGLWVGFKLAGAVAESSGTVTLPSPLPRFAPPPDFVLPPDGLNLRWPDAQAAQEERVKYRRLPAALAFARANTPDRIEIDAPDARIGILTAGKAYVDVRQALDALGLDAAAAARRGIRLMKLGLTWPVEPEGLRSFARGLERIVVVEEKRGFVESQVKEILYGAVHRPLVLGKEDETGRPLFPATMELDSGEVALALVRAIPALSEDAALADRRARLETAVSRRDAPIALRTPFFCAGCPHNTSTVTPDESLAIGGIGCHTLAAYMDRDVRTYTHMGGEGASWIGLSPFTDLEHVFQNVGDGTYMHSGSMGIRAAVAAGVNVTFKILYNDAVAMTGGQPVEGGVTVAQLTRQLAAEGVAPIVVVSDEPEKFAGSGDLAPGTTVHHRDRLDAVQRSLRETTGVSALVYEQTCAAEKRRRRKRDAFPDPPRRVVINELVCEGCGHCGTVSNCVAIVPVETPFGRKRQIDQTACNKDFSCLKGFCPSFVTVEGRLKQGAAGSPDYAPPPVPEPDLPSVAEPYAILIAGTGGTGVVTVGALLGTAARIDGLACSVNDVTGMAQKGGPVLSHVTLAPSSHGLHAIRIPAGAARLLLGADLVVSTMPDAMRRLAPGTTRAVVNAHRQMTGDFTRNADQAFPDDAMRNALRAAVGADVSFLGASNAAVALTGDATAANLLLLGHAWQKGWVPLSRDAIESAIRLNGARIEDNLAAFAWGRALAHDPSLESRFPAAEDDGPETLDALIARRAGFLADYQNAAYAARYSRLVESVRAAEREICGTTALTEAVARGAFKLMAYKDEYEVARLHTDAAFHARIAAMFEDGFRLSYHLAPPIMGGEPDPRTGQPRKRAFGPWMLVAFRLLARLRVLRGTRLDPFGRTAERRAERALIAAYERTVAELCAALAPETLDLATEIASLPERIRGYGAIKDASIAAATAREADLLARLRDPKKRAA